MTVSCGTWYLREGEVVRTKQTWYDMTVFVARFGYSTHREGSTVQYTRIPVEGLLFLWQEPSSNMMVTLMK